MDTVLGEFTVWLGRKVIKPFLEDNSAIDIKISDIHAVQQFHAYEFIFYKYSQEHANMCVRRMSGSCVYNRKTYLKGVQKQQMVEYNIEYPYNEIILKSVTQAYLLIYGAKTKLL